VHTSQRWDPAELRLLIELAALRKLADRGLSDDELAVGRRLAGATVRPARDGDARGYLRADMTFHGYLLELAGDRARSEVARLLLARSTEPGPDAGQEPGRRMAAGASEHGEIVDLLADDRATAAADLLRHHLRWPVA
jgi:DNA-binding GntR family transcriptional regulator